MAQTRIGDLVIDSADPCAPRRVLDGIAWDLACGGTVTNAGRSPVAVVAEQVDAEGQPAGDKQRFVLQPGDQLHLDAPASGQRWLVVAVSRGQAELWGWLAIGGFALVSGLALYGGYAAVRGVVRRARGRR